MTNTAAIARHLEEAERPRCDRCPAQHVSHVCEDTYLCRRCANAMEDDELSEWEVPPEYEDEPE